MTASIEHRRVHANSITFHVEGSVPYSSSLREIRGDREWTAHLSFLFTTSDIVNYGRTMASSGER